MTFGVKTVLHYIKLTAITDLRLNIKMNVKSHVEPFYKGGEKNIRRNDFNDECQCFEENKKKKDDENRSASDFSFLLGLN